MKEKPTCHYCNKGLEELAIVNTHTNHLFCLTEHSPLEPESCALKYLLEHPEDLEEIKGNYFFTRIK